MSVAGWPQAGGEMLRRTLFHRGHAGEIQALGMEGRRRLFGMAAAKMNGESSGYIDNDSEWKLW